MSDSDKFDYFAKVGELIQESRRQLKRDFDNEAVSYQTFMEKSLHLADIQDLTCRLMDECPTK